MKFFFTLCLFPDILASAKGQVLPGDRIWDKVRRLAVIRKSERGVEILDILQDSLPQNSDYKLYLARVHGWNKDYSTVIDILTRLVEVEDFSKEAMRFMVDAQLWAENFKELTEYSSIALQDMRNRIFKFEKPKLSRY